MALPLFSELSLRILENRGFRTEREIVEFVARLINNRLIDMANGIVWRKHMKSSSWDGCAVAPWNDEEALAIAYALALPTTPIPLILPVKTIDL
jgi:hypothetical protein